MLDRKNGYYEIEVGKFNAGLINSYSDVMIAKTDGELIIGYTDSCDAMDVKEVSKWADEYGYEIEWR